MLADVLLSLHLFTRSERRLLSGVAVISWSAEELLGLTDVWLWLPSGVTIVKKSLTDNRRVAWVCVCVCVCLFVGLVHSTKFNTKWSSTLYTLLSKNEFEILILEIWKAIRDQGENTKGDVKEWMKLARNLKLRKSVWGWIQQHV